MQSREAESTQRFQGAQVGSILFQYCKPGPHESRPQNRVFMYTRRGHELEICSFTCLAFISHLSPTCSHLGPSNSVGLTSPVLLQGWTCDLDLTTSIFYPLGRDDCLWLGHVTQARPMRLNSGTFTGVTGKEISFG